MTECPTCNSHIENYPTSRGACACGRCWWGVNLCEEQIGDTDGEVVGGWRRWSKDPDRAERIMAESRRVLEEWASDAVAAFARYEHATGGSSSERRKLERFVREIRHWIDIRSFDPRPVSREQIVKWFQA